MDSKNVLVTGGAGYIGSHMVRLLKESGWRPIVFDNLSTGHREFVPPDVSFVQGDLKNPDDVRSAFKLFPIKAVIHFAASIVVPESVANPLKYYENNVVSAIQLIKVMQEYDVNAIVFSSTACVYGDPEKTPITEDAPLRVVNPYGASKIMVEQILRDLAVSSKLKHIILRYFNVAGSHPDGDIGIKMDKPTHLIPNVIRTVCGTQESLTIFGSDYDTPDGTCVRDYVHVMDLCDAHLLALKTMLEGRVANETINLGSSNGFSVLQVVKETEAVVGKKLNVTMADRRPGDSQNVVASNQKAARLLGWKPKRSLKDIISSAWTWEQHLSSATTG